MKDLIILKSIRLSIKNLKQQQEALLSASCGFWACTGHESGRIKSMATCGRCRAIILGQREIVRLEKALKPKQ